MTFLMKLNEMQDMQQRFSVMRIENESLKVALNASENERLHLEKQKGNILESYRMLEKDRNELREIVRAINDKESGQYWAWQPDFEENHLETLSCPVLIPAEWLRNLLEEVKAQRKDAEALALYLYDALEATRVFMPGMRTRDVGTCKKCGGYTSSGMDHYCKGCAQAMTHDALMRASAKIKEIREGGEKHERGV